MRYAIQDARTVEQILRQRAEAFPEEPLFLYWDEGRTRLISVSARSFFSLTEKTGAWMLRQGWQGKRLAIVGENSLSWIAVFFSVVRAGATAVLLDRNLPVSEQAALLSRHDCSALFCSSSSYDRFCEELPALPCFRLDELPQLSEADCPESFRALRELCVQPDDPALIAFTSGTSGKSKGVVLTHDNVASDIICCARSLQVNGTALLVLPLHHMFGMLCLLGSMAWGRTIFINQSLRYIPQDVASGQPLFVTAVPAMLPLLFRAYQQAQIKEPVKIIVGGAPVDEEWKNRFRSLNVCLYSGYGMTECAPTIAFESELFDCENGQLQVLDVNEVQIDRPQPDGVGEILVRGRNVFSGYYGLEEETAAALQDGWLHTGDLGRLDAHGHLSIVGRKKNLLVLANGENISSEAIEQKVCSAGKAAECVAFVQDGLLAVEIYAPGQSREDVQNAVMRLNHSLASTGRIMKILFRETEFPKNTSGKIIRNAERRPDHV